MPSLFLFLYKGSPDLGFAVWSCDDFLTPSSLLQLPSIIIEQSTFVPTFAPQTMGKKSLARQEEEKARESKLQRAIANDDVAKVHELIAEERGLLDRVSKHPFPNTPLHLAAAAGKTQVAMEMAILKPSFARKLNPEGYSPMHLALQHEHYHTVRSLMTIDPKLIRVRGQCGITPLHYVAVKEGDNELELLAEFLCACKSSIEDLTSRCETAVHVAVKNHNLEAFKVLFGWLKRFYLTEILNWKDEDGNTVLHIAESEKQTEVIKLLSGYVKVGTKNFRGKTAREISQVNPSSNQDLEKESRPPALNSSLSQFLRRERTLVEKYAICFGFRNESARGIILLVAALIAAATYQAALTPPGGFWQDNSSNPPANSTVVAANSTVEEPHKAGKTVLTGKELFPFVMFNGAVFSASILAVWITAIPLLPHSLPVYVLAIAVSISFIATAAIGFPKTDKVGGDIIVGILLTLLVAVAAVPFLLWAKYIRSRRGVDATWRRVGNFVELEDQK